MNSTLRLLLDRNGGLLTREQATELVPYWVLRDAHRRRQLRRGLRTQLPAEPVHIVVPARRRPRDLPHVTVHQRAGFAVAPPHVVVRRELPVTRIERTLVDAWPLLTAVDRTAPLIRAVNDRFTTPERLVATLAESPRLPGRAALRVLLDKLAAGCRSPLEIWGHDHVFTGPGMPEFVRQRRIRVGGRTIDMDVYAERERVDFELDGATAHGTPQQREVDVRRDALLATIGILVVRFTHRRLIREPERVRREVLAILANRRT